MALCSVDALAHTAAVAWYAIGTRETESMVVGRGGGGGELALLGGDGGRLPRAATAATC